MCECSFTPDPSGSYTGFKRQDKRALVSHCNQATGRFRSGESSILLSSSKVLHFGGFDKKSIPSQAIHIFNPFHISN